MILLSIQNIFIFLYFIILIQVNPLTRVETKTQCGSADILLGKDWSKRISKTIASVVWLQSGRAYLPGQTDHSNTGIQSLLAKKNSSHYILARKSKTTKAAESIDPRIKVRIIRKSETTKAAESICPLIHTRQLKWQRGKLY